ncbi:hypothetical protein L916_14306, partial [Phytophthora nicotianae]
MPHLDSERHYGKAGRIYLSKMSWKAHVFVGSSSSGQSVIQHVCGTSATSWKNSPPRSSSVFSPNVSFLNSSVSRPPTM